MSTRPVTFQAPFGSLYQEGSSRSDGRLNVDLNQTSAFIPPNFLEGNPSASVHKLYKAPQIDPNQEEEIKKLMGPISAHCEMRIQSFYQMLCLVFGSNLVFKSLPAQGQAGMKNGKSDGQLAEAHSSTIPSLLCWEKGKNEDAFSAEPADISPYVFGKESSFSRGWQATVRLPAFVNIADSRIDFSSTHLFLGNRNFRQYCVELLNHVSDGTITPNIGLSNFLHRFLQVLAALNSKNENGVMNCYASVAKYYLDFIKEPSNLAKLSFEKGPQLPYDQIQKEMWQVMVKDIEVGRIAEEIQNEALEILEGSVNNKEYLLPGILLRLFPGSLALHVTAQQEIIKLQIRERTPSQLGYASQLASDKKIVEIMKEYVSRHDDFRKLSQALIKSAKNQRPFYRKFKETAEQILNKSPQQPHVLFWTTIPLVYAHLHSTEDSRAVRQFLCINDSWFSHLTQNSDQIQKYIAACCENQKIVNLANRLVEILRKQAPQEEMKMEICEDDLSTFKELKRNFRTWRSKES